MRILTNYQSCPKCKGTGVYTIKKGKDKGKQIPCPRCKGLGGWLITIGLTMIAAAAIAIYVYTLYSMSH